MPTITEEYLRAKTECFAQMEQLKDELNKLYYKQCANPDWKYVEYVGDVRNKLTKIVEGLKSIK